MVAGHLSIMYGLQGPNIAITTACTTGTHNIGFAARMIQHGDADVMLAGGAEKSPPGSLALVAPKDAVYGLLRMFQALSEGQNLDVQVFRTIEEAVEWLEVPADLIAP